MSTPLQYLSDDKSKYIIVGNDKYLQYLTILTHPYVSLPYGTMGVVNFPNSYVGIGLRTPLSRLHVNGEVRADNYLLQNGSPAFVSLWSQNGSNIYYNSGNVGIGTSSPVQPLHIATNNNNTTLALRVSNDNVGGRAGISFNLPNNVNEYYSLGVDNDRYFKISNGSSLATNTRAAISPAGNVLIGTTTDSGYNLQVAGNQLINTTGNTSSTTGFKILNSDGNTMLHVLDNGNVGINIDANTSTSYRLRVNGGIWANSFQQLQTLNGSSGVGRIEYYNTGGSNRTLGFRTYGSHPSESVKGFVELSSQVLTYSGMGNVVLHADPDFADHPTLVIRSLNTSADSFYMQNYHHSQGALFITKAASGGDDSIRFRPGRTTDKLVINTTGIQVSGTVSAQLTAATQTNQVYYDSVTGELTYGSLPVVATPTLNDISQSSVTTTDSIYQMSSGTSIEFKSSNLTSLLYLDEINESIGIGTNTTSISKGIHIQTSTPSVNGILLQGSIHNAKFYVGSDYRTYIDGSYHVYIKTGSSIVFNSHGGSYIGNAIPATPRGLVVNSVSPAYQALVVKGSGIMSANLQEWINSSNIVQSSVDYLGRFSIGHSNPSANLDVVGTLQFVTGNQGAGKILASDVDGNADWINMPSSQGYIGLYDSQGSTSYCGIAPFGSATSDPVWKVTKIIVNLDGSTTVTVANNIAWDNRLTETYT